MSVTISLPEGANWQSAVTSDGDQGRVDPRTGYLHVETDDGGLLIKRDWKQQREGGGKPAHADNLSLDLGNGALATLAEDLLRGIEADDRSRLEYLETVADAIAALGLTEEKESGDAGSADAPLEGMSRIRHPLLLKACIRFQADFVAEMLPSDGPVKVRNDEGEAPGPGDNPAPGSDPLDPDDIAQALQTDMNHYLTQTASEYYPDTTRSAFRLGLSGCFFKKVYNCPLRRRPVSESVDAADIIVSYGATDLRNAERVTHRIRMTQAQVRRMMRAKVYRDVYLGQPTPDPDPVEIAEAEASGTDPHPQLPAEYPHTIYECYAKIDPDAVWDKGTGDQPYRITIDKDSRQILDARRDWDEDDPLNQRKDLPKIARETFVKFSYIDAIGFYGIGLMHILGNTTRSLTALWREFIDAGMMGNFPGLIGSDATGRANTSDIRVPPGGVKWMQTAGKPIQQMFMPLPYKSPDAAFMQFTQHVEEVGDQLGGTASVPLNEGVQNAPVGTMLATIEQALKPVEGVFKGLHRSQAQEFQLLKQRFREDPEAMWRFNRKPAKAWERAEFLQALDDYNLVPMADPNTASQVQRIMKAAAVFELAKAAPQLYRLRTVAIRLMRMVGIPDPEELLNTQAVIDAQAAAQAQGAGGKPGNPAVDQSVVQKNTAQAGLATAQARALEGEAGIKANAIQGQLEEKKTEVQADAAADVLRSQDLAADRASKEKIAAVKLVTEQAKLTADMHKTAAGHLHEHGLAAAERQHDVGMAGAAQGHEAGMAGAERGHEAGMAAGEQQHQDKQTASQQGHEAAQAEKAQGHEAGLAAQSAAAKEKSGE